MNDLLERSSTETNSLANIELIEVSKSFGPLKAVKELNLVVKPGEIRGLLDLTAQARAQL